MDLENHDATFRMQSAHGEHIMVTVWFMCM